MKYQVFYNSNNFLSFAGIKSLKTYVQSYLPLSRSYRIESQIQDIMYYQHRCLMSTYSLYCDFCHLLSPSFCYPLLGAYLQMYTCARSFHNRFISLICVFCPYVSFPVVCAATSHLSNERQFIISVSQRPSGLLPLIHKHSSPCFCHGIFR